MCLGLGCLAASYFLLVGSGPAAACWSLLIVGLVLLGLAAVTQAIDKGRNPAWGVLSIVGIWILSVLPDRRLRRLDQIEEELTGRPGELALYGEVAAAWSVPFWGLYCGLRGIREARVRGLQPPVGDTICAAISTVVAVAVLGIILWKPRTDEVAYGKLSLVRLPPGWVEISEKFAEISRDDPGFQVAVASRKTPAAVTVSLAPKPPGMDIDEFAEAYSAERRQILGPTFVRSGPSIRTAGTRRLIEYQFHGPADRKEQSEQLLTFWETPQYFWVTMAWTSQDGFRRIGHELRLISESVYSTE